MQTPTWKELQVLAIRFLGLGAQKVTGSSTVIDQQDEPLRAESSG